MRYYAAFEQEITGEIAEWRGASSSVCSRDRRA